MAIEINPSKRFAQRVQFLRKEKKGWSQEELASQTHLTRQGIARIERGEKKGPEAASIIKILSALNEDIVETLLGCGYSPDFVNNVIRVYTSVLFASPVADSGTQQKGMQARLQYARGYLNHGYLWEVLDQTEEIRYAIDAFEIPEPFASELQFDTCDLQIEAGLQMYAESDNLRELESLCWIQKQKAKMLLTARLAKE